jgi:hypothetical protein
MTSPYFSDAEVDEMTAGLEQPAAKARYLRRLGFRVDRKPNGRPLAWRPTAAAGADQAQQQNPQTGPNVVGLDQWSRKRKHGTQAQGR